MINFRQNTFKLIKPAHKPYFQSLISQTTKITRQGVSKVLKSAKLKKIKWHLTFSSFYMRRRSLTSARVQILHFPFPSLGVKISVAFYSSFTKASRDKKVAKWERFALSKRETTDVAERVFLFSWAACLHGRQDNKQLLFVGLAFVWKVSNSNNLHNKNDSLSFLAAQFPLTYIFRASMNQKLPRKPMLVKKNLSFFKIFFSFYLVKEEPELFDVRRKAVF